MPARLSDDVIMGLLEMEAESQDLPRDAVGMTDELEKAIDAYEDALNRALAELVERFPPADGNTIEDLEDEGDAAYNVLMTLRGEGVGIWDGRWDEFYDDDEIERVQEFLEKKLHKFADDTGSGSLNTALMNAAWETAGGEETENLDERPGNRLRGNGRARRKTVYRVRGSAGYFKDRDRLLTHGMYTISRDVDTEAEARRLMEQFLRDNPPKGREAKAWLEKSYPSGDFDVLGKWSAPDGNVWVADERHAKNAGKSGFVHKLPDGTRITVYKSREQVGDPWTAGPNWDHTASPGMTPMLGMSETASSFSQFTDGQPGKHLGKKIRWSDVPEVIQRHIIMRVTED